MLSSGHFIRPDQTVELFESVLVLVFFFFFDTYFNIDMFNFLHQLLKTEDENEMLSRSVMKRS